MTDHRANGDAELPLLEELTTAECWALLQEAHLGRIALVDAAGKPEIFPVNHVVHEGALYLRSARGTKLSHLRQHPDIAFEVDGGDGSVRWSVILRGTGEQVAMDDEIRRSGALRLQTDIPSVKPFVIRLSPTVITGRRFHVDATPPAAAPGWVPVPEPAGDRAARPHSIPHRPPVLE